jgi:hypothetical protein
LPTSYDTDISPSPEYIGSGRVFNGTVTINEESATTTVYTVNLTVSDQALPEGKVTVVVNKTLTDTSATLTLQINDEEVAMNAEKVEDVFNGE